MNDHTEAKPPLMADAKHTGGPWNVRPELPGEAPDYRLIGANIGPDGEGRDGPTLNGGIWIAKVQGPDCVANARLIASAPDLLEALKACERWIVELAESGDAGFWDATEAPEVIQARAAISRATEEHS